MGVPTTEYHVGEPSGSPTGSFGGEWVRMWGGVGVPARLPSEEQKENRQKTQTVVTTRIVHQHLLCHAAWCSKLSVVEPLRLQQLSRERTRDGDGAESPVSMPAAGQHGASGAEEKLPSDTEARFPAQSSSPSQLGQTAAAGGGAAAYFSFFTVLPSRVPAFSRSSRRRARRWGLLTMAWSSPSGPPSHPGLR